VPDRGAPGERPPARAVVALERVARHDLAAGYVLPQVGGADRGVAPQVDLDRRAPGAGRPPAGVAPGGEVGPQASAESLAHRSEPGDVGGVEESVAGRRDVEQELRVPAHRGEVELD